MEPAINEEVEALDQENKEKKQPTIQEIVNVGAKVFALFLGLTYVCGFLTLNSYFYKYGIVDLGIASSDYLVAGSLFILYLVTYALFGGRAIVLIKVWMGRTMDQLIEKGGGKKELKVAAAHSYIELIFLHCLSASCFASYAFGQFESFWFYAVLGIAFLITYRLDVSNKDIEKPFASLIIDITLKIIAIVVFFAFSSTYKPILVFFIFFGFSMYINLVLDSFERYTISNDRIVFTLVLSVVFFLGSAVSFGAVIYGDITKKIGGGKNIPMEMGVAPGILDNIGLGENSILIGEVVYSSQTNIYIQVDKETLVLPRSSIQWMKFRSPNENEISEVLGIVKKKQHGVGPR